MKRITYILLCMIIMIVIVYSCEDKKITPITTPKNVADTTLIVDTTTNLKNIDVNIPLD